MGVGEVAVVCETLLDAPPLLVTLPGGLQLTAWHPIIDLGVSEGTGSDENNDNSSRGCNSNQWVFPAQLAVYAGVKMDDNKHDGASKSSESNKKQGLSAGHLLQVKSLFNVALLPDAATDQPWHGCVLNGVPTILLGHGIEGDAVASHAYYGTHAVLEDLARFDRDGSGYVQITSAHAAAAVAAVMDTKKTMTEKVPMPASDSDFTDGDANNDPMGALTSSPQAIAV